VDGDSITSFAGTGEPGFAGDGSAAVAARLNGPFDLAFDPEGRLVFSDTFNHRVRRIDPRRGTIETLAGNGEPGFSGDGGPATAARLHEPYGVAIGSDDAMFIVDRLNRRVRRVDRATGRISTLAGDGRAVSDGDGGPAAAAGLAEPNDACLDAAGRRLFIADVAGHRVRVVDLATGRIATFAGTGEATHRGDGGPATAAALHGPRAVAIGAGGALLILERNGNTLRRVDPATGTIATIAGTGTRGAGGDGGPALAAEFAAPKELGIDRDGGILIVDTETHRIRRIDPAGIVTTLAGTGLARPHGIAVGPDGAVYIGDTENHRIARLSLSHPGPT
jgi:sugar lactone lactonase YvrE